MRRAASPAPDQCQPLRARLFGYGVLYRARLTGEAAGLPGLEPIETRPADEARALAQELACHAGKSHPGHAPESLDEVGVSLPFGRCGIEGLPREHLRVYHVEEAYMDVLAPAGPHNSVLSEGQTVTVDPGTIIRLRVRPRIGHRPLVAFQTEDRSPLHGHAAPMIPEGEVPHPDAAARLAQTTAAFQLVWQQFRSPDPNPAMERLSRFFADMRRRLEVPEVAAAVAAARQAAQECGSYGAGAGSGPFEEAHAMLTPDVVDRISAGEVPLFRFPGMFGAVAALSSLMPTI